MIVFNWEVYEQPNFKDATSGQLVAYQKHGFLGQYSTKKDKILKYQRPSLAITRSIGDRQQEIAALDSLGSTYLKTAEGSKTGAARSV